MASAYGERIASMEVEVKQLKEDFQEFKVETKETLTTMDDKLDRLIGLRNKGAGILWLLSSLLGSGGMIALFTILGRWKSW